jgi:hypothetical protein
MIKISELKKKNTKELTAIQDLFSIVCFFTYLESRREKNLDASPLTNPFSSVLFM